jgi:hypothetical protein
MKVLPLDKSRPRDYAYYGKLDTSRWGISPVSVNRDSDALERSNFKTITEDLLERYPKSVQVEHAGHWLVGWIDQLWIDTTDGKAQGALLEWLVQLEQDIVADDRHYYSLQMVEEAELRNYE